MQFGEPRVVDAGFGSNADNADSTIETRRRAVVRNAQGSDDKSSSPVR